MASRRILARAFSNRSRRSADLALDMVTADRGHGRGSGSGSGSGTGRGGGSGSGTGRGGGRGRGRGWYYKNKYGGGRSGHGRGTGRGHEAGGSVGGGDVRPNLKRTATGAGVEQEPQPAHELRRMLEGIDGRSYGAYKALQGQSYAYGGGGLPAFTLRVDHVQGDAFAPPSRLHATVPMTEALFPPVLLASRVRRVAVADFVNRVFHSAAKASGADVRTEGGGWRGAKGGEVLIDVPNQHVLERTSVSVTPDALQLRFTVALPARGRTVCGKWAAGILSDVVPKLVRSSAVHAALDATALEAHVCTVEDQDSLRRQAVASGLVAFVGNGSVLPRKTGADDRPMPKHEAMAFQSPPSLLARFTLPNRGVVQGMGVRAGNTLCVGGGFHGKSTVLKALEAGVYNKVPGDGRELVVTHPTAVKVRAEDGRSVAGVDISAFINNLPRGRPTHDFYTSDASGSTSQAASLLEAIELGCRLLLIDEDTAATNFMIRDRRMTMLVAADKEPITPFVRRVGDLAARHGVSTVLVIGGTGDYFEVADCVIHMDNYTAKDVTAAAAAIVASTSTSTEGAGAGAGAAAAAAGAASDDWFVKASTAARHPVGSSLSPSGRVTVKGKDLVCYGDTDVELSAVEQLVHPSQTRFIAAAMAHLSARFDGTCTLRDALQALEHELDEQGLDVVHPGYYHGAYARPRMLELAAAINRLRTLKISPRH